MISLVFKLDILDITASENNRLSVTDGNHLGDHAFLAERQHLILIFALEA